MDQDMDVVEGERNGNVNGSTGNGNTGDENRGNRDGGGANEGNLNGEVNGGRADANGLKKAKVVSI
jgi:hypothetical protein